MKRKLVQVGVTTFSACLVVLLHTTAVHAQGTAFEVGGIENILWSVVKTIQKLAVPITAIALVAVGIGIVTSGEDDARKTDLKKIGGRILIGGVLVFGAATLAELIKNNLENAV